MKKGLNVFKFGGASLKEASAIKNVASILQRYKGQRILIIVSAMGKTTNALEEVVKAHATGAGNATELYDKIKQQHYAIMSELFEANDEVFNIVNDTFVEAEWVLEEEPHSDFDFMYDQIVTIGELVSSKIAAAYLNKAGLPTEWQDARDVLKTDNTYREARIQWTPTIENAQKHFIPKLDKGGFVLTQGFIGSTSENFTTSLGREGSDYSAAIFSFCLDAEAMTIWKDVPGVLTGDPRVFENVTKLDRLSYKEAIEMTYYGATVIHPKTIKPLQNKNIPLFVKSFLNPSAEGTYISSDVDAHYPPIIIMEKNQVLLSIASKDFSFIAEHHLAKLFQLFDKHRVWVNMMRNTAISFMVCAPDLPERLNPLIEDLKDEFSINKETNCELITIRHYQENVINHLKDGKIVLLEEKTDINYQMVVKNIPMIRRKEA